MPFSGLHCLFGTVVAVIQDAVLTEAEKNKMRLVGFVEYLHDA